MADILHRVGVKTPSPDKVYEALTAVDGLAGWWTDDTTGRAEVGGVLAFRFPPGGFDMEVVDQQPGERVTWKVVDGWKEPVEFMHHCSTKWATYLMSLKSLVETGEGAPRRRRATSGSPAGTGRSSSTTGRTPAPAGEDVHAFVTPEHGMDPPGAEELIHHARARVGSKAPEVVEVLDELPRTATGKLDRAALEHRAAEHLHHVGARR